MNVSRYWTLRRRMIISAEITLKYHLKLKFYGRESRVKWQTTHEYVFILPQIYDLSLFLSCSVFFQGEVWRVKKPHIIATFSTSPRNSDLRFFSKKICFIFFPIIISSLFHLTLLLIHLLDHIYYVHTFSRLNFYKWFVIVVFIVKSKTFEKTTTKIFNFWTKEKKLFFIKIHQS